MRAGRSISRRQFIGAVGSGAALQSFAVAPQALGSEEKQRATYSDQLAEPPRQKRPSWWREHGVVIAGNWQALPYSLRAGGTQAYDEKIATWRHGYTKKMAQQLKDLGFNLIMIPLYEGFGLKHERAPMEDAKRFAAVCHALGLRVGAYMFSGTIGWESLLAEDPYALDWCVRDEHGNFTYYDVKYYRRWVNRAHPGVRAMLREVVRYGVEEVKLDLLHFDNYMIGPGYEEYSTQQFREFLKRKYTSQDRVRRFGFAEAEFMEPPPPPPQPDRYNADPLYQDFVDFRCETVAKTYQELAEYARSLNPEVIVELNPHGYYDKLNSYVSPIGAVDHTRTIGWGGAFWDEGYPSRLDKGLMVTRFRSHMLGRQFDNMVFQYTADPVAMAESMANNLQCLGCPVWFSGGQIAPMVSMRGSRELDPLVLAMIRFFHRYQEHFRDAELVANVGVLNTYANTAYGSVVTRNRTAAFEQALYQGKIPFTLVPGRFPGQMGRFVVVVLADITLVSDVLVDAVRDYVAQGGGLVMTGGAAQYNEHYYKRPRAGLADLFPEPLGQKTVRAKAGQGRAVYVPEIEISENFEIGMLPENRAELLKAVHWAAGRPFDVEVRAPETVSMSLYHQPEGHRLLHLVNYDESHLVDDVDVVLQWPEQRRPSVTFLSPDHDQPREIVSRQEGQELRFTVPQMNVYALLVIK